MLFFWSFDKINLDGKILDDYEYIGISKNEKYSFVYEVIKKIITDKCHWIWTGSAIYTKLFLEKNKLSFNGNHINGEDQEFSFSVL
jgi:hypothetical protein